MSIGKAAFVAAQKALSEKGAPGGVATLDADGRIPPAQYAPERVYAIRDDADIHNAIADLVGDGARGVLEFAARSYETILPIKLPPNCGIRGQGQGRTIIAKVNNALGSGTRTPPRRGGAITDDFANDAIIQLDYEDLAFGYRQSVEGVSLTNTGPTEGAFGIYAPRATHAIVRNVLVSGVEVAYFAHDGWLNLVESFTAKNPKSLIRHADDGSGESTGTSLTVIRSWSEGARENAYDIFGLWNSAFIGCVADNVQGVSYHFTCSKGIALDGCGTEGVASGTAIHVSAAPSSVVVSGFNTRAVADAPGGRNIEVGYGGRLTIVGGYYGTFGAGNGDTVRYYVADNGKLTLVNPVLPSNGAAPFVHSGGTLVDTDAIGAGAVAAKGVQTVTSGGNVNTGLGRRPVGVICQVAGSGDTIPPVRAVVTQTFTAGTFKVRLVKQDGTEDFGTHTINWMCF